MTEIVDQIEHLIAAPAGDLGQIERTLTDGYAYALSLEAERLRLERRISEVTHGLERGDTAEKARELSALTERVDGNSGDLVRLRALLGELRRHAHDVRRLSAA